AEVDAAIGPEPFESGDESRPGAGEPAEPRVRRPPLAEGDHQAGGEQGDEGEGVFPVGRGLPADDLEPGPDPEDGQREQRVSAGVEPAYGGREGGGQETHRTISA